MYAERYDDVRIDDNTIMKKTNNKRVFVGRVVNAENKN